MNRKPSRKRKRGGDSVIHWIVFIILLSIFALVMRSVFSSFNKKVVAQTEERKYSETLKELEAKKNLLESRIEYLTTDRGREAELRNKYDLAGEGETVIRIID
ncbi:hypothetical protein CL684_02300 [Candidatus Campbellbacteria bacterium]|nr:hypothetical protein [Candidatus Campbellbacteria bacterium]|tara:strand:+ start:175 stop:483 length:309 start_codon:yes stop_codon:yes gene_type:complete